MFTEQERKMSREKFQCWGAHVLKPKCRKNRSGNRVSDRHVALMREAGALGVRTFRRSGGHPGAGREKVLAGGCQDMERLMGKPP